MRKIFSLCVLVVLTSSFYGCGQSTNKAAKQAFEKGFKAHENKEFNSAVIYYTKAIELDPKYVNGYILRGVAYDALKKYPEAIADYTKAIELDPKKADAYYNRGVAYDALKKYEEALADYTKAIEIDPKKADAYFDRGEIYRNLNNRTYAVE